MLFLCFEFNLSISRIVGDPLDKIDYGKQY